MAVLLLAGMSLAGAVGAALLLLVTAFLAWLLALSWPVISLAARLVRVTIIGALLAVAALKVAGLLP